MSARPIRAYLVFDSRIIFRERFALFMILALPGVMYGFFAVLFGGDRYSNNSFYDEYTASFAGLILLNIALMNIAPGLTIYRELGFFRRLMVSPLPMSAIWLSAVLRSALLFLLGQAEMLILGYWIFGQVPDAPIIQLLLSVLISMFGLFSMGFLLGSVFRNANSAFNAGILLFQPMLLLSGASFPLTMFPDWIRIVTQLIPMTHVVEVMRLGWRGELFTAAAVWPSTFLLIFGSICAFVAQASFRKASV
jgi:ABC-2 type transport system permease protein